MNSSKFQDQNFLIVLSPQNYLPSETRTVNLLFENGLNVFHLRKPTHSLKDLRNYLKEIPEIYHNRIVSHGHAELLSEFNLKGLDRKSVV